MHPVSQSVTLGRDWQENQYLHPTAVWAQLYVSQPVPFHKLQEEPRVPHISPSEEGHHKAFCAKRLRHSHSRLQCYCQWSRSQHFWSPSPGDQLPSSSPTHSRGEDDWLHFSFSSMGLQPQQQEYRRKEIRLTWPSIAQMYTAEWPIIKSSSQGPAEKEV